MLKNAEILCGDCVLAKIMFKVDGRGHWTRKNKKRTVDQLPSLRIADALRTQEQIRNGRGELGGLRMGGGQVGRRAATAPPLGGQRYWFRCPGCGRRCAILSGGRLLCRKCLDLAYRTAQQGGSLHETVKGRLQIVLRKLEGRKPGEGKPKGMHRDTYQALCKEYWNLYRLEEWAFYADVAETIGVPLPPDVARMLQAEWERYQEHPDHDPEWLEAALLESLRNGTRS